MQPWAWALSAWRRPLRALGWLGRDESRYGGYGFGNLSARVDATQVGAPTADTEAAAEVGATAKAPAFLVTGTQTGGREHLSLDDFALVEGWDLAANRLWSRGLVAASSESLTHAALYDASPRIGAVFHVHAPALWGRRRELGLEETAEEVPYGTPEMAAAVVAAWQRVSGGSGVVAMGGHEDGLLAWGGDPAAAGQALLTAAGWLD